MNALNDPDQQLSERKSSHTPNDENGEKRPMIQGLSIIFLNKNHIPRASVKIAFARSMRP